jgi:hypothetical protein
LCHASQHKQKIILTAEKMIKEDGTARKEIAMRQVQEGKTHMDRETEAAEKRTGRITAGRTDGKQTQTGGRNQQQGAG